ncbi:MAG: DoxX family membrane protein [Myxococcales bacterium]|nr:DoxX family membrane protein [Myxococcales bacterium]
MKRLLSWRGHPPIALVARLYLGWVFLYACWHKLLHPGDFALDIATYQILPLSLVNLMAIVLPWLELIAGGLLVIGFRTRAAALCILGMMAMFSVAIAIAVARGQEMSCGCFASQGLKEDPISWLTVLRDLGWTALAAYVLVFDRRPLGVDGWLMSRKEKAPASV